MILRVTSYNPSPARTIIPTDANTSSLAKVALTYTPVMPINNANNAVSFLRRNASHPYCNKCNKHKGHISSLHHWSADLLYREGDYQKGSTGHHCYAR